MSMAKKPVMQQPVVVDTCPIDPMIAGIAVFLLLYGLVMVGSASLEVAAKTYGNSFHLLTRHSIYLGLSGIAATVAITTPIQVWQKFDVGFLAVSLLLLIAVLVPGVGKEVNGSTRWISLPVTVPRS